MNTEQRSERRRYLRIVPDRQHPVRVDLNGSNFIDILHANDISEGGLGVRVHHRFSGCDIGEPISFVIDIPLPHHALLHGSGTIKHIAGDRFGIVFDTLPEHVRTRIRDYVALCLKEESWWAWLRYKLGFIQ